MMFHSLSVRAGAFSVGEGNLPIEKALRYNCLD